MIRTRPPKQTVEKSKRHRNVAHLWTDKRVLRFFRKNFDRRTFKNLKDVYLALCEIESDFGEKQTIHSLMKTVATYAGMDMDTIRPYMQALLKINLIDFGQEIIQGKFSNCWLMMYEWVEAENQDELIHKILHTVTGKTGYRENPLTEEPVNRKTGSYKNTSYEVINIKNSINRKYNHCGFDKPQELSLNTSSNIGEKEESPIHQKRPPLSARQGGKTKRKLSPLQIQQYGLVINQFRKFQHQCLKIKSTAKDREAWMYGPIHKMIHGQGISPERIISAINWYIIHYQDQYVPAITSPYDLLNKFSKLEAAMNRKPESGKKGPGWAGDGDFSQFKVQTWIDNGDGTWTDSESGARYDKPSFKGNRI